MGLFDKKEEKPQSSIFSVASAYDPFSLDKLQDSNRYRDLGWTIPEAYLALLFLAADADGNFVPEERLEIETTARRAPALRALIARGEIGSHEQSALQKIAQNKQAALEEACATLPSDMVLSVFAHCVDLMMSDGDFSKVEQDWVEALYPKLGIPETHARRIVEVLALKARY
jgi:uncharacterized tellurite resistance protein B-like protein